MDEFMRAAIEEARMGSAEGGIPIGSVLVRSGKIIGRGHNRRVQEGNPMKHAEIDCLMNAGRVGRYDDTVLYSTLMPCYLCAGAVVQFNIPRVIAGEATTLDDASMFGDGLAAISFLSIAFAGTAGDCVPPLGIATLGESLVSFTGAAGFSGMSRKFTTCCNWQFGVRYYGLDAMRRELVRE